MKYVEIILKIVRVILRTLFPKQKNEPEQEDVAAAQSVSDRPPGFVEERDSTGHGSPGRDPLVAATAPAQRGRAVGTPWLGIAGFSLILAGGAGYLYEFFF